MISDAAAFEKLFDAHCLADSDREFGVVICAGIRVESTINSLCDDGLDRDHVEALAMVARMHHDELNNDLELIIG